MSIRDNSPEGQIVEKALENWKQGMEPKANAVHVKREREYEQSIEDLKKMLPVSPSEDKTAPDIGNLKYRIGEIFMSKFLEHNEGKFNKPLEMNPPIHAVAEFCMAYGTLCRNKAIEEALNLDVYGEGFIKRSDLTKLLTPNP